MFKKARPFFLHVITSLHAGSGNDLGIVDLPIQREKHTDYPKIESSSLKGGLREAFEEKLEEITVGTGKVTRQNKQDTINLVFGPEKTGNEGHAGAIGFTDGRTLLFPVKSMKGVFAWITCTGVLDVFARELALCGINTNVLNGIQKDTVSDEHHLLINGNIILEEYAFKVNKDEKTIKLASWLSEKTGIEEIKKKLVILSNDDFRDFVNLSTEVITRTKINNETGTVEKGALFTEEFLPAETVMYSLVLSSKIFKEKNEDKDIFYQNGKNEEDLIIEYFIKGLPEVIQLGGDATLGKGIIRTKVMEVQNG